MVVARIARKTEAHDRAEATRERERSDHRRREDDVPDRVEREQQTTKGRVDGRGGQGESDDGGSQGAVRETDRMSGGVHGHERERLLDAGVEDGRRGVVNLRTPQRGANVTA